MATLYNTPSVNTTKTRHNHPKYFKKMNNYINMLILLSFCLLFLTITLPTSTHSQYLPLPNRERGFGLSPQFLHPLDDYLHLNTQVNNNNDTNNQEENSDYNDNDDNHNTSSSTNHYTTQSNSIHVTDTIKRIEVNTTMVNGATRDSIHVLSFRFPDGVGSDRFALSLQNAVGNCQWAEAARLSERVQGLFTEASLFDSDCQLFDAQDFARKLNPRPVDIQVYNPTDANAPWKELTCSIQFVIPSLSKDDIVSCYIKIPPTETLEMSSILQAYPSHQFAVSSAVVIPVISLEVRPELEIEVQPPGWTYDNDKTRYDMVSITVTKVPAAGALIPLDLSIVFKPNKDNELETSIQLPPIQSEYYVHQILTERPAIHCNYDTRLVFNTHTESLQLFLFRSFFKLEPNKVIREHCYTFLNLGQRLAANYPRLPLNKLQGQTFEIGSLAPPIRNQPHFTTTGNTEIDIFGFRNIWGTMTITPPKSSIDITNPISVSMEINAIGLSKRGAAPPILQFVGFSSMANTTTLNDYTRYLSDTLSVSYSTDRTQKEPFRVLIDQIVPLSNFTLAFLPVGSCCVTISMNWLIPISTQQLTPFILDFVLDGRPLTFVWSSRYSITSTVFQFSDYSITTDHSIISTGFPFLSPIPNAPEFIPFNQRVPTPKNSTGGSFVLGHPGLDFLIDEVSGTFGTFIELGFPLFSDCDFYLTTVAPDNSLISIHSYDESTVRLERAFTRPSFNHMPTDMTTHSKLFNLKLPLDPTTPLRLLCQTKLRQPSGNLDNNEVNEVRKEKNVESEYYYHQGDDDDDDDNDNNNSSSSFPSHFDPATQNNLKSFSSSIESFFESIGKLFIDDDDDEDGDDYQQFHEQNAKNWEHLPLYNPSPLQDLDPSHDNLSNPTKNESHSTFDTTTTTTKKNKEMSKIQKDKTDNYFKPPISLQSIYFDIQLNLYDVYGYKITPVSHFEPPTGKVGSWKTFDTATTIQLLAYFTQPISDESSLNLFIDGIVHVLQSSYIEGLPSTLFSDITRNDLYYMQASRYPNHFDNAFYPVSYSPFDLDKMCRGLESFSWDDRGCGPNDLTTLSTPTNAARLQFSIDTSKLTDYTWARFKSTTFKAFTPKEGNGSVIIIPDLARGFEHVGALLGPKMTDFSLTSAIYPLPVGAACSRTADCISDSICWGTTKRTCRQTNRYGMEANEIAQFFSDARYMSVPYQAINHTYHWYLGNWGLVLLIFVLWFCSLLVFLWCFSCWWTGQCCCCYSRGAGAVLRCCVCVRWVRGPPSPEQLFLERVPDNVR